jgi:hypothetical protein
MLGKNDFFHHRGIVVKSHRALAIGFHGKDHSTVPHLSRQKALPKVIDFSEGTPLFSMKTILG